MKTKCPVCATSSFEFLLEGISTPDSLEFFRFYHNKYYMQCKRCGTIVMAPLDNSIEKYKKFGFQYYNQLETIDSNVEEKILQHIVNCQIPSNQTALKVIREKLPNTHNWLDVGSCGYLTHGKFFNFHTIEPDPRTVEIGRRLFNENKIHCNILEKFNHPNKFDGVLFQSSFICVTTPLQALQAAAALLKDKGHVLIAISHYFMGTKPPFFESEIQRIEDIFRGDTFQIFYDPNNLKYICQTAGFKHIEDFVIPVDFPQNPNFTIRYFIFQKCDSIDADTALLDQSKSNIDVLLKQAFEKFNRDTRDTLENLNNECVLFVGSPTIFNELSRISPLDKIYGFIDVHNPHTVYNLNGAPVRSIENLTSLEGKIKVVLATFKYQAEARALVNEHIDRNKTESVLRPSRHSAVERIHLQFRGKTVPAKSFVLQSD